MLTSFTISHYTTYLHAMDCQTRSCVQLLVAYMTLEMLCLLMLYENLFIVKFSVTILESQLRKNVQNVMANLNTNHTLQS